MKEIWYKQHGKGRSKVRKMGEIDLQFVQPRNHSLILYANNVISTDFALYVWPMMGRILLGISANILSLKIGMWLLPINK